MIEVELVGGESDGVRINMATEQETIDVPIAFFYKDDVCTAVDILRYEHLGRASAEGRPLYGFLGQAVVEITMGDDATPTELAGGQDDRR